MSAEVRIQVQVPERGVAVELSPRPGVVTAVIGPNGAGKSTLLEAISGSLTAQGSVRVDGRELTRLPPHRRGLGVLQQRPVLFETMSVRDNVAFGPRAHGAARGIARERAVRVLERVGAQDLASRRPRTLSGGQAQRVALARTLAVDPTVMLLDEPFAALDAEVTSHLRSLLAEVLADRTTLLVTHDLLDVLALAQDVAVLEDGHVVQLGTREEVLSRPPTAFVAHLVGRELLRGVLHSGRIQVFDGPELTGRADPGVEEGQDVLALVDPAHVRVLGEAERAGAQEQAVTVAVTAVGRLGADVVLRGGGLAARVDPARAGGVLPRVGQEAGLAVGAEAVRIYPVPSVGTRT